MLNVATLILSPTRAIFLTYRGLYAGYALMAAEFRRLGGLRQTYTRYLIQASYEGHTILLVLFIRHISARQHIPLYWESPLIGRNVIVVVVNLNACPSLTLRSVTRACPSRLSEGGLYEPSGNDPGTSYYIRAAPQLGRLLVTGETSHPHARCRRQRNLTRLGCRLW